MPFFPGSRLGPYEILSPVGAGGMGEVYRAHDPRMGRDVAIKVSAERFSDRFEREVHAVAALNHPNICHIYDVGPNYLVMELVEGATLADRIKRSALPLEEALTIARQIADALEAAHEKGIIHRDLKPGNIKITPDGVVKVLDFGLAKIAECAAIAQNPENSPTLTMDDTRMGQILGTAAYMSPEQARGLTVDKRADIWSFGVVLLELLTGERTFAGETFSDTLSAVLTKEPEWEGVPHQARRLLRRCLEKDPKKRLRDIGDAWDLLNQKTEAPTAKNDLRWKVVAGVLGLGLIGSIGALWRQASVSTTLQPLVRLDLDLGPDVSLGSSMGPAAALSPDGTRLAFASQAADGTSRLFARRLDEPKAAPLPGTEGAYTPFFSPDGQWVGFFAQGKLKKARIDGGETVSLCDAYSARGGSWGQDGNIVAAFDPQTTLSQIPAEGGKPIAITELRRDTGEFSHRWPQVLPGGRAVLFTASSRYANFEDAEIAVVTLKDRKRKTVLEHGGMFPRYLATGHLIYIAKGILVAAPFDLEQLELRGPPVKVLEDVPSRLSLGFAQLDFSRSGTLSYLKSQGLNAMQWLDERGNTVTIGAEAARYVAIRLSPDGARVAATINDAATSTVWVYDWQRGSKWLLSKDLDAEGSPVWSPDARFVVFESTGGIFWTRSDGAGRPQPLTRSKNLQIPGSFSPDGKRLAYAELIPGAGAEVRIVRVESASGGLRAGEPETFLKTPTVSSFPAFSSDGRWLAYSNPEGGNYEVYVRAFPDNGAQWQISNVGGMFPVWSRNGHELFYRTEDQRVMVVDYGTKADSFVPGKPRLWSGKRLANVGLIGNFDLTADGKRLVVLMPAGPEAQESQRHIMLLLNFFDEVRRRVGGQAR